MGEKLKVITMGKIMQFFRGKKYSVPGEVLQHATELSRDIKEKIIPRKSSGPSPDATSQKLLRLAPVHLTGKGYYDLAGLTNAVVAEIEKEEHRALSDAEKRRLRKIIPGRVKNFKEKGRLTPSTGRYKSPSKPILRDVTKQDLQRHMGLIGLVLRRGHKFLRRDWRRGLSYPEAKEIGNVALARAIQTHREGKWAFSTVATGMIASEIDREASRQIRQKSRTTLLESMERTAAPGEVEQSSPKLNKGKLYPSQVKPKSIEEDIKILLRSKQAKPEHAIIHTLVGYHGYSYGQIAKYIGVTAEAVSKSHDIALEILKRRKR